MKIDCGIASDLIPLYLEELCSEDSRAALEEHLRECPACREKLERMKSGDLPQGERREDRPLVTDYAKRVRRHRVRVGIAAALAAVLAAFVLALTWRTGARTLSTGPWTTNLPTPGASPSSAPTTPAPAGRW